MNKFREKWETIREKDKLKFIINNGVLLWGVTSGILWAVMMHILKLNKNIFISLLIAFIIFPLAGIFYGLFLWEINEKKYKKLIQKTTDNEFNS